MVLNVIFLDDLKVNGVNFYNFNINFSVCYILKKKLS